MSTADENNVNAALARVREAIAEAQRPKNPLISRDDVVAILRAMGPGAYDANTLHALAIGTMDCSFTIDVARALIAPMDVADAA